MSDICTDEKNGCPTCGLARSRDFSPGAAYSLREFMADHFGKSDTEG